MTGMDSEQQVMSSLFTVDETVATDVRPEDSASRISRGNHGSQLSRSSRMSREQRLKFEEIDKEDHERRIRQRLQEFKLLEERKKFEQEQERKIFESEIENERKEYENKMKLRALEMELEDSRSEASGLEAGAQGLKPAESSPPRWGALQGTLAQLPLFSTPASITKPGVSTIKHPATPFANVSTMPPAGSTTVITPANDATGARPRKEQRIPEVNSTPSTNLHQASLDVLMNSIQDQRQCTMQNTQAIMSVVQVMMESQRRQTLPAISVPTFTGDVTEYQGFIDAFEAGIAGKTFDDRERLSYLNQFLRGEAKMLLRSCSLEEPSIGYPKARKLLETKYGAKDELVKSYIYQIGNKPRIKHGDVKALSEYALFLSECEVAARRAGATAQFELPERISLIVNKLPKQLGYKWDELQYQARWKGVPFYQLVKFVEDAAEKAKLCKDREDIGGSLVVIGKGSTAGTKAFITVSESEAKSSEKITTACPFCMNAEHKLRECTDFSRQGHTQCKAFVKGNRLCFRCLETGHSYSKCNYVAQCQKCSRNHVTALHLDRPHQVQGSPYLGSNNKSTTSTSNLKPAGEGNSVSCLMVASCKSAKVTLPILELRANVRGAGRHVRTFGAMDICSNHTFCTRSLARKLGVSPSKKKHMNISTLNSYDKNVERDVIIGLQVQGPEGEGILDLKQVILVDHIPATTYDMASPDVISRWPYLEGVKLGCQPQKANEVELLIGGDNPLAHVLYEAIPTDGVGPNAYKYRFGWVVVGPTHSTIDNSEEAKVSFINTRDINECLKDYFDQDFSELEAVSKVEHSQEDKLFLKKVNESIYFDKGHYTIGLPFRDDKPLPNNRHQVENRLRSLKKRLLTNDKFREDYVKSVQSTIENGHAELVPESTLQRDDGKVWYLPHHGVYHPRKPEKLRVVYDCSCKYQGKSLNECLLQGPDLTSSLVGVLTRFRHGQVPFKADIEKMFYQVKVPAKDRDVMRFLWWPNGDLSKEPREYRMTVHVFGATSSPSCVNFALRKTADDHCSQFSIATVDTFKRNSYMDDVLKSVNSVTEAKKLATELRLLAECGGFHLTQFASSSKSVLLSVPHEERASTVKEIDLGSHLPAESALGVDWCLETDTFGFRVNVKQQPLTRRGILSTVASIYDPLGLAAPFILIAKQLLQSICKDRLNWDEPISEPMNIQWQQWLVELGSLVKFRIPRCFVSKDLRNIVSYQLHHFSDASTSGYGTVSYLRIVDENEQAYCTIVAGKARVAPLKTITIPRLELTAARVAVRMDRLLRQELDLPLLESVFWTDSTPVLKYLRNDKARYHTFVANRVSQIRELSSVSAWKYVDTKSNPADLASRGAHIDEFLKREDWIYGPSFLAESEEHWPVLPADVVKNELEADDIEVKRNALVLMTTSENHEGLAEIFENYSSWTRLQRVMAWVLRFIHKLKDRTTRSATPAATESVSDIPPLEVQELECSENAILKLVQAASFEEEIKLLAESQGRPIQLPKSNKLVKLNPYLSTDGLLRVGGRLRHSNLAYDAKHPIILPKESWVSKLLVLRQHEKCAHSGRNYVLSHLRQKYWILGAGTLIKKITSTCTICRRLTPRPLSQIMSDLPEDRLTSYEPPFTHTGVDCFGPFMVKRGRSNEKHYGVIFTCLTSRAVHLEVVESLDTSSFIMALRRFCARRGSVKLMRSDNGSNFIGAERELRQELSKQDQSRVKEAMLKEGISWVFNPPAASHFGGVWERQIRSVRRILSALLGQQRLTREGIETLMCEVEAILNSRPLTRLSDDPQDNEPITPNHLLTLKGPSLSPGEFMENDNYSRRRWRQVQYLADQFWKRWVKEYLPLLQERSKWTISHRNLSVGDVVLVIDEQVPRCSWPIGKIVSVVRGKDGRVRSAKVKTQYGEYERPISKMCMLLEDETTKN